MKINGAYRPLKETKKRFNLIYGGAGSGKSYAVGQHVVLSVLNGENWLVLRKFGTTIKESTFSLIKDIISTEGLTDQFNINKTDRSFEFKHGGKIIMMGLDDPEKIKSLHKIDKIWIEEATEFTSADIKQLNLRLRGEGVQKQYFLTFNPIDVNHWIKRDFFDNDIQEPLILKTTYKDNRHLDQVYVDELEKLKDTDEYYYNVYCLGHWGVISNARVFHNLKIWDFDLKLEDLSNVRYGMDFGFVHASTLSCTGEYDGELYIYNELYKKGLTPESWIDAVSFSWFDKSNTITADSAEPARITAFRNAGFKVESAKKPKNSLRDGINNLCEFPVINIHRSRCPNAVREFQNFKRRELKDGSITEDFVELDDDVIASVRYGREEFLRSGRVMKVPDVQINQVLGW